MVGGGLWTAIDLFVGLVVGPILGRLSIPARTEFTARFMPKMVLIMPTLVLMTLAAGLQLALQLGNLAPSSPNHAWLVASFCVVGVMAVIALGVLEPANIAVLFEMHKARPDGEVIARLMKRFVYTAGITGADAGRDADHHDQGGDPVSAEPGRRARGLRRGVSLRWPELATVSLAMVVIGGILMASYVPRRPPLALPTALACLGAVLVLASVVSCWPGCRTSTGTGSSSSSGGRCWPMSSRPAMIGFAFVRDHTRGAPLALVVAHAGRVRRRRAAHHRLHGGALLISSPLRELTPARSRLPADALPSGGNRGGGLSVILPSFRTSRAGRMRPKLSPGPQGLGKVG